MRLVIALVIAALVVAAAAWILSAAPDEAAGPPGRYGLTITGPGGTLLEATPYVEAATALSVLLSGTHAAGIDVDVRDYDGFGRCDAYVHRIGAYAGGQAGSGGGWTFQVAGPDGAWEHPLHSAECVPVPAGGSVRWVWTDGVDEASA